MADVQKIESAVRRVRNQASFIQDLLIDALGWEIDERAEDIEEISFEWSAEELRADGLEKHLVDGTIRQIRPFKSNPWGIFILEFKNPDVFATGRGMTVTLRNVLRGLVPSKRKRSSLASFQRENLLFICNHDYRHYRFAHFKSPGNDHQTAPLAAFGWGPGDPIRTLCEYNLNALAWPEAAPNAQAWVAAWSQAFDVEKVTKRFYADYAAVFEKVENLIAAQGELAGDDLRMFTQTLFNRLMFLRFIERKGWLEFDGETSYLRALYAAGGHGKRSFYSGRLRPLFFQGLAVEGKQENAAYGRVPYLNGGLFERSELDKRVSDLPDEVFAGILSDEHAGGLFYRYNFTVEESTPLDIEVAVDPEMLGKVFEELVTGRHESGSYYTPRPVVSFMCREALKGYLSGKTKASPEAVASLVDRHQVGKLKETHAREILGALDDVKAVDPACGSGAYLLGLLQELITLYRLLYSEKLVKDARTLYDLKLRIISQSLYGVDIDPFATNIAKLRLWLSLAVEADQPVPLPNLDFKIETGDSLLAPDPQEMPDLFRGLLQMSADTLTMLKRQYFLAHGQEKESYRRTIDAAETRLRSGLKEQQSESVVDWRIQFAEAFAQQRRGFDIVLANPPYIRKENIDRESKPALRTLYRDGVTGQSDLFCYFYIRGLQLLRPGGLHVFICSNSWLDSGYGNTLQEHLLRTSHIQAVYDSAVERQFATADINTIISVLRKGRPSDAASCRFVSLRAPFVEALAKSDCRREIVLTHRQLCDAGMATADSKRSYYAGNKWGGKYLRAPDVYHVLVDKGRHVFSKLREVACIEGYIHDNNTGSGFPEVPFLKSVKNADMIQIRQNSPGVICWGVKSHGNSRLIAPILFPRTFGTRHIVVWNPEGVFGKEFYKVLIDSAELAMSVAAQLNSSFGILQREILGLVNLGDGAIKFSADDVGMFEVIPSLAGSEIAGAFESLVSRPLLDFPAELCESDRQAIDSVMFDRIGLTASERDQVYDAVLELIVRRVEKAKRGQ